METKEIQLVLDLVRKGLIAVERGSNVLWTLEDLMAAQSTKDFQNNDQITEPSGEEAISGLYPGCLNMGGALTSNVEPLAQTTHFLFFGMPRESHETVYYSS
jgi:hypothetical protein